MINEWLYHFDDIIFLCWIFFWNIFEYINDQSKRIKIKLFMIYNFSKFIIRNQLKFAFQMFA